MAVKIDRPMDGKGMDEWMDQLKIHGVVDGWQSQSDFRNISIIKNLGPIFSLMIFTSYANILMIIEQKSLLCVK